VIRRGDLRPDAAALSAEVVATGDGDSVVMRAVIENASPFALDEVQVHLWQDGQDLADSVYVPLAPWQRDTLALHWRVSGSGATAAYLSAQTGGLDEDTAPTNNTIRFTYANGVVSVEPSGQPRRVEFFARGYPNPARGTVTIRYGLPTSGPVSLRMFDVAGRVVATLVDEVVPAGEYVASWNRAQGSAGRAAAGVYFYELTRPIRDAARDGFAAA
jgi:hypothetical protein